MAYLEVGIALLAIEEVKVGDAVNVHLAIAIFAETNGNESLIYVHAGHSIGAYHVATDLSELSPQYFILSEILTVPDLFHREHKFSVNSIDFVSSSIDFSDFASSYDNIFDIVVCVEGFVEKACKVQEDHVAVVKHKYQILYVEHC